MTINKKKIALVFPGQGSQSKGMGEDLCKCELEAKNIFQIVDQECDFDLFKVCWDSPDEVLKKTIYAQPAIFAASAAALQVLRNHWTDEPVCVAGHSLGELAALWAADVYRLRDAARLVTKRGQYMEEGNTKEAGAMSAVLGADAALLEGICAEHGAVVANHNTPQQFVISGSVAAVQAVTAALTPHKAKVIALQVSGAFHSQLMGDANKKFNEILSTVEFNKPICPVIQNVTGHAHTDPTELRNNLSCQMVSSVYWTRSVETMLSMGVETIIEVGSGKVLSGLIKKIDKNIRVLQVGDTQSLQETLGALQP